MPGYAKPAPTLTICEITGEIKGYSLFGATMAVEVKSRSVFKKRMHGECAPVSEPELMTLTYEEKPDLQPGDRIRAHIDFADGENGGAWRIFDAELLNEEAEPQAEDEGQE